MAQDLIKPNQSLVEANKGIEVAGLEGVPESDLPLPMIKLVSATSQGVELPNGQKPKEGSFFHTGKSEAHDKLLMRILAVSKGMTEPFDQEKAEKGVRVPQYAIVGILDDIPEPVFLILRSSNYYEFRSKVLNQLKQYAKREGKPIYNVLVHIESMQKSKDKYTYWVMKFQIDNERPVDKELDTALKQLQSQAVSYATSQSNASELAVNEEEIDAGEIKEDDTANLPPF